MKFLSNIFIGMSFLLMGGCNTPRVINLSTYSDIEDPKTLNISFDLKGELKKKYDVKMSIVNNLTKQEELVPNNEISPLTNNLLDSRINPTYKFIYKSNKYDFSNNIYSLKVKPTIAKSNSAFQNLKMGDNRVILNVGFVAFEGSNTQDYKNLGLINETFPYSGSIGLFNDNYGVSLGVIKKPNAIQKNIFRYDYPAINYYTHRSVIFLGFHKKIVSDLYCGINLGLSKLYLIQEFGNNLENIRDENLSYFETAFNTTYIVKNLNFQLNISGFSWSGEGNLFKNSAYSNNQKLFVYPTITIGLGYNFGF